MRCDSKAVRSVLANISQQPNNLRRQELIQEIVSQTVDGGRNILHMCAAMCVPSTNKETDEILTNSHGGTVDAYTMTRRNDDPDRSRA